MKKTTIGIDIPYDGGPVWIEDRKIQRVGAAERDRLSERYRKTGSLSSQRKPEERKVKARRLDVRATRVDDPLDNNSRYTPACVAAWDAYHAAIGTPAAPELFAELMRVMGRSRRDGRMDLPEVSNGPAGGRGAMPG